MKTNLHILFVGSETSSLEKIRDAYGVSLTVLTNNLNAVNHLNTNRQPDAIICDYNLPGSNGLFLFDWIRKHSAYNRTPFILLGKIFSPEIFKLALKKRVDDYYVSTVDLAEDLLSRVKFLHEFKSKSASIASIETTQETYKIPISKRLFDIVFASVALLFASPFLILILLAIRLESKGKVYYIAKRVGRNTFDFYKLRSMRTGSDELLKKLAKEKNQYNNEEEPIDANPSMSCPKCSKEAFCASRI